MWIASSTPVIAFAFISVAYLRLLSSYHALPSSACVCIPRWPHSPGRPAPKSEGHCLKPLNNCILSTPYSNRQKRHSVAFRRVFPRISPDPGVPAVWVRGCASFWDGSTATTRGLLQRYGPLSFHVVLLLQSTYDDCFGEGGTYVGRNPGHNVLCPR
jgi:hypothetical protein